MKNYMGGACGRYDGQKRYIRDFDGETRGENPFGRPRCRWSDGNKMDLQRGGWGGMDWMYAV
jgi:hypothetical protein